MCELLCYSCKHYVYLYEGERLHTLDDMSDCWYEPYDVYGCSLAEDGLECSYLPKDELKQ